MGSKRYAKKYSFASVGELQSEFVSQDQEIKRESFNIGIKTPLELGDEDFLVMHKQGQLRSQIADNLRSLILTNKGERLGNYDFGANLKPLIFELGSENGDITAMNNISRAVKKYMPFINLLGFETELITSPEDYQSAIGKLIKISYEIPNLKTSETFGVEVELYFGE